MVVRLRLPDWPAPLEADLEASSLILSDGRRVPVSEDGVRIDESPHHQVPLEWEREKGGESSSLSTIRIELVFDGIDKRETESFDVELGEIRRDGEALWIDSIHFRKERGWAWVLAP